jgi:hypothetical protein
MDRQAVTPNELQQLLRQEFARREPTGCPLGCKVPAPFRRDPPKPECSNWQVKARVCARGCDSILQAIREQLKQAYDLAR